MTKGTKKIHHATGLYLDGIRDGNIWGALQAHTGARYTQHSTGVGDGKQGFADFFAAFVQRYPVRNVHIIRAIEDGQYVFLHVLQSLNNGASQWVTADLFDTDDNDRVIEHWDVIQEFQTETQSGCSMIDGPTEVGDLAQTDNNKALVQEFCDCVLIGRQFDKATDFISSKHYVQHHPNIADGFATWVKAARAIHYWKVHRLMGQGHFVVTLSHTQIGKSHYCVCDIFRLSSGLIVEHWDVTEKILAPEEWNNQGKF